MVYTCGLSNVLLYRLAHSCVYIYIYYYTTSQLLITIFAYITQRECYSDVCATLLF